jgi:hypothetical protein
MMKEDDMSSTTNPHSDPAIDGPSTPGGKSSWVEPKLEFVEPKLTLHGNLGRVTGGFLGTFNPEP